MEKTRLPTSIEIEELTAFLPILYAEGFKPVIKWEGGKVDKESGLIQIPYPEYDDSVKNFFKLASSECWRDYDYTSKETGRILQDPDAVRKSSLSEIKTLLTYCVRGERFSDGHWGAMIEQGYIRIILERLTVIISQMN